MMAVVVDMGGFWCGSVSFHVCQQQAGPLIAPVRTTPSSVARCLAKAYRGSVPPENASGGCRTRHLPLSAWTNRPLLRGIENRNSSCLGRMACHPTVYIPNILSHNQAANSTTNMGGRDVGSNPTVGVIRPCGLIGMMRS
jgi:hypothetical protein